MTHASGTNRLALLTAVYVVVDDLLPARSGRAAPEDHRRRATLRSRSRRSSWTARRSGASCASRVRASDTCLTYIPKQPGYNKRLRRLAPAICQLIGHLARNSPSFCDRLRLIDSTPVPCGASRETVKRSELAGHAAYGYCASHSRYFWGLRLYLVCAPDGMTDRRSVWRPLTSPSARSPRRCSNAPHAAICCTARRSSSADKGFAGAEFEQFITDALGAQLVRPDRKDEQPRFGALGGISQWIESVNDTSRASSR